MSFNKIDYGSPPNMLVRLFSVWYRHYKVYTKNIFSNGFPPFMEPLIFLAGMGLGLGGYIADIGNMSYVQYLAIGLPLASAMFTSAFECSFGSFIRLEFSKTYDGMLTGPISITDLFVGEILWAGTKGAFYSTAVLSVFLICNVAPISGYLVLIPLIGFTVGVMFAPLSLIFMSFVKSINTLNFYLTGFVTPMFMFSGVMFPISNLPRWMQIIIEFTPLVHVVNIERALFTSSLSPRLIWDLAYCIVFTAIAGYIAVYKMKKRLMK